VATTGSGYCSRAVEEDRFAWHSEAELPALSVEQFRWLLECDDIGVMQRHPPGIYVHVG